MNEALLENNTRSLIMTRANLNENNINTVYISSNTTHFRTNLKKTNHPENNNEIMKQNYCLSVGQKGFI